MAKRRTPPLFEVLGAPDRRSGPGSMLGGRPVQVPVPRQEPVRTVGSTAGPKRGIQITTNTLWLGVAVVMAIAATVWFFAFKMGEQKKLNDVKERLIDTPKDAGTPNVPLNPQGTGPGSQPPGVQPDPVPPQADPNPLADPRKPGNNYLHIVILPWKDAEKAVAFLNRSGLPAFAVPDKKLGPIDPAEARAKNRNHLVFALESIPSGQYTASERKRQDLIDRVRQIGKKWQREEKGPSDFGEPGWALFK